MNLMILDDPLATGHLRTPIGLKYDANSQNIYFVEHFPSALREFRYPFDNPATQLSTLKASNETRYTILLVIIFRQYLYK